MPRKKPKTEYELRMEIAENQKLLSEVVENDNKVVGAYVRKLFGKQYPDKNEDRFAILDHMKQLYDAEQVAAKSVAVVTKTEVEASEAAVVQKKSEET